MSDNTGKKKLIIGITGASGIPLAVEVLRMLRELPDYESHLVMSDSARVTIGYESDMTAEEIEALADVVYDNHAIGAAVASGSFRTEGMLIVPCSMKTVAGIWSGYSDSLLLRAADVVMKERRKLVLAVRECPFSSIHLRNMKELSEMGAEILPMVMTFYNRLSTVEEMVHHMACRCLERFGIEPAGYRRWEG